jgi:2-polyprenyl-3-methyl-5-hydroxy-6-metoxy-1,4-benzoquinol methylase
MNPYRNAFYQRQAEWHRYENASHVHSSHELRSRYYEWYTRHWLPENLTGPILDIGCGSGQFLHFLNKKGYTNIEGIDIDLKQIEIAKTLGFSVKATPALDYLENSTSQYDLIVMLDIIEHFTREELYPLIEAAVRKLRSGGRLIASVPNAESPTGLQCIFTDITHEIAFTPMSLEELLFCHNLEMLDLRDPWPAPVSIKRRLYYSFVRSMRFVESLRLRSLGFQPPRIWSNVMWVLAVKPGSEA